LVPTILDFFKFPLGLIPYWINFLGTKVLPIIGWGLPWLDWFPFGPILN